MGHFDPSKRGTGTRAQCKPFVVTILLVFCAQLHLLSQAYQYQSVEATLLATEAMLLQNMTDAIPIRGDTKQPCETCSKKSIAYAITITSCPFNGTATAVTDEATVVDGPAVLRHSIHQIHARSRYAYQLYAFVHPDALACVPSLEYLGYHILVRNVPIDVSQIQSPRYKKQVEELGCCGSRELLKLWAFTMVQHEIFVHTDTDVFFNKPMDHIFDAMLNGSTTHKLQTQEPASKLPSKIDFLFTRDYLQQSQITSDPRRYGVQGGFFVGRPSIHVFNEMKRLLLLGDYTHAKGWGKNSHGGYWGAPQIQGFLSYYYTELHPEHAVELNRCLYNNMLDDPTDGSGKCRTGGVSCQDCRKVRLKDMISVHLTLCWKPWQVCD